MRKAVSKSLCSICKVDRHSEESGGSVRNQVNKVDKSAEYSCITSISVIPGIGFLALGNVRSFSIVAEALSTTLSIKFSEFSGISSSLSACFSTSVSSDDFTSCFDLFRSSNTL